MKWDETIVTRAIGFGVMPGFNRKKRSNIGGDFDGDGVRNRRDCEPLNFRKQHKKKTPNELKDIKDVDFQSLTKQEKKVFLNSIKDDKNALEYLGISQ